MRDVAAMAGVAPMTVSRVLSNSGPVSDAARAAVNKAVERLGYVHDFAATSLSRKGGSKLFAVVLPTMVNPVFAETFQGIEEVLTEAGYSLIVAYTGFNAEKEEKLIRGLLGYRPEAVILTGFAHTVATAKLLKRRGIPVVETWNIGRAPIDLAVGFSNHQAGLEMTRHLIERGYRRIGFISGLQKDNDRTQDREAGYRAALADAGLSPVESWIRVVPGLLKSGADAAREFAATKPGSKRPDAIFVANDVTAVGFVLEATRLGLRIPQDVAVAGFDDAPLSAAITPALTTVHLPKREIGQTAALLALRRLRGEAVPATTVDLGFTLIPRDST